MALFHLAGRRYLGRTQAGYNHAGRTHQHWTTFGVGLALLAAVAAPVAAQTLDLQSGDTVTVSGAGTQGIYQGQTIANTTTTYTADANSSAVTTNDGSIFTLEDGGTLTGQGSGSNGIEELGGTTTINGGNISGQSDALLAFSGSTTQITGGNFSSSGNFGEGLDVFGGDVMVSGGAFSAPDGYDLFAGNGGVLDLFGTFNGYSSGSKITSDSGVNEAGVITGTLLDGEAINATYYVNNEVPSTIEFNVVPVPELSSAGSLGLGLAVLGLFGVAGRRRERNAAQQ